MDMDPQQIFPRPLCGAPVGQLPSALVPARSTLRGTLVDLEPQHAVSHAQALFDASHGDAQRLAIWDYMAYGPWASVEDYTTTLRQQTASHDTIFYSIRHHDSGEICGQASYLDINAQNGVIEIGHIWLGPTLQRSRAGTEALFLMLRYAFDELGYRRMQWKCNALNQKSRAAAHRLGFRFEGIFYNHLIFKGKNRDTAWYSILDDEWPQVREILETWLADENFDAAGVARQSLSASMTARTTQARRV